MVEIVNLALERAPRIEACASMLFRSSAGGAATMTLPKGGRLVMFVRGEAPAVVPIEEPGAYEIDVSLLANGRWPVLVSVVPAEQAATIAGFTVEHVERIIARAALMAGETKGNA